MPELYLATVTVHVVAALVWLGGMCFFAIAAPVLRKVEDDTLRARLFEGLGLRFRSVGWACVGALLVTGVLQLVQRGWWGSHVLASADFWGTPLGRTLAWKVWLVAAMIGIQAIHDFWLGPAAGRAVPGSERATALRGRAAWLARLNAVLGLVLVYVAVRLGRGG